MVFDNAIVEGVDKSLDYKEAGLKIEDLVETQVSGNAKIYGDARCIGMLKITDDAQIYDNAIVSGANISGRAKIFGRAVILGQAYSHVFISDDACIDGNAQILDRVSINGNTRITDNARVQGGVKFWGRDIEIGGDVFLEGIEVIDYPLVLKGNERVVSKEGYENLKDLLSQNQMRM